MSNPYKTYNPPASSGSYLKLTDGEAATVRLAGEPVVFESHYTDEKTDKTTVRTQYAWKAWNFEEQDVSILNFGVSVYKQIAALAIDADWGDPSEYNITIKREGTGLNTKYTVTPKPNRDELPSEAVAALKDIDIKEKTTANDNNKMVFYISEATNSGKA